jgi:hypothetical protein
MGTERNPLVITRGRIRRSGTQEAPSAPLGGQGSHGSSI